MSWHGQINRTIWEIREAVKREPDHPRYRRELLRAHFLQHFELDRTQHIPRDDRSFLFLNDGPSNLCLLFHGAKGTPAEMRELGNFLHSKGLSVYCPRFARTGSKDRYVSWESWVTRGEIALEVAQTFNPDAFVVGLSLGGTIALLLASERPLRGVVALAPAIYPKLGLKRRILEIGRVVTPTLFEKLSGWDGEILKAMHYARRTIRSVEAPVLALQAADDSRLSTRGMKFVRRNARHHDSEITLLPRGGHVLTRGETKTEVFERIRAFVEKPAPRMAKVSTSG